MSTLGSSALAQSTGKLSDAEDPNVPRMFSFRSWFEDLDTPAAAPFLFEYCNDTNHQQLDRETPWGQKLTIMSKIKDRGTRRYHMKATVETGWSRNVLIHQITSQAYERHRLADTQHSYEQALPVHQAEQLKEKIREELGVIAPPDKAK